MRRKLEIVLYVSLGMLLGVGVATYRNFLPGEAAQAQDKQPEKAKGPAGVFSPPGTFDSGTVVPPPNLPPFKGKIGRTVNESTPDWPPLARAPKGAPNVLYIVLDDVGYAALGCYGSPVCKTPHMDKLAKNGVRYNNFHTTALCSPSRSCFMTGPQSSFQRHGLHHRGFDRLSRLLWPGSAGQRLPVGDADAVRLGGVRDRQMASDARGGHEPGLQPQVVAAGPRLRSLLRIPGRRGRSVHALAGLRQSLHQAAEDAGAGLPQCTRSRRTRPRSSSPT